MAHKPLLVLVSNNYPFRADHGEVMFLKPEIPELARTFDRIVVAPLHPEGPNLDPSIEATVDLSLAERLRQNRVVPACRSAFSENFRREAWRAHNQAGITGVRRALGWSATATVAGDWAQSRFGNEAQILFYTYWRTGVTLGLLNASRRRAGWKVVTRVHGHDLYLERHHPPYQPFSPGMYRHLAKTYTVSQAGQDYLGTLGVSRDHTAVARLGVEDPGHTCRPSDDGVFRLVSCSLLVPLKRVPLLAQGILAFAGKHPSMKIQWTHLGDGNEKGRVARETRSPPENLRIILMGQLENSEILRFYRDNPCDLFVHLSASEGLPMVMQEASSVGLPILATNVGGVNEIVTPGNGRLLPANPSLEHIVEGLEWFAGLEEPERSQYRKAAREVYEKFFNARENHHAFARSLLGNCLEE